LGFFRLNVPIVPFFNLDFLQQARRGIFPLGFVFFFTPYPRLLVSDPGYFVTTKTPPPPKNIFFGKNGKALLFEGLFGMRAFLGANWFSPSPS